MTKRRQAMTLIELLIAMAIAAIMVVIVYSLFNAQSKALGTTRDTTEADENVRSAMDMITRDIRSAGFLLPDKGLSLRIENNCGHSATGGPAAPMVDWSSGVGFTVPGSTGTAINANGEFVNDQNPIGTQVHDGCPNGSDRITMTIKPTMAFVQGYYSKQTFGNSFHWNIACPFSGTQYDCSIPIADGGVPGGSCSCGSNCDSAPISLCTSTDPFSCVEATLDYSGCVSGGACLTGQTYCTVNAYYFPCNSPSLCKITSDGTWSNMGNKYNTQGNSWRTRTYQLMDTDGDGTTELVYSDDVNSVLETGAATATWVPVANDIDDLQFAVAYKNAPDTYYSDVSMYDVAKSGTGCTENSSGQIFCLDGGPAHDGSGNNPPVSIRVTIVGRTARREMNGNGVIANWYRTGVEDNNPPQVPFVASPVPTGPAFCYGSAGCGCGPTPGNMFSCGLNGNAQGYRRRVLTQIVALRNLAASH